jgi:excisionase family DNA binding protein
MLRPRRAARIVYSIRELADLVGMPKPRMARLLVTNGVRFSRTGNKRLVFLSDLEAALPELMDSTRFGGSEDE